LCGVATFDSHGRAPYFSGRTASRRPGYCLPYANHQTAARNGGTTVRMLKPVDPALFLLRTKVDPRRIDLAPACPRAHTRTNPWDRSPSGSKDHAFNAPTQQLPRPLLRPIFGHPSDPHFASRGSCNPGRQALPPRPRPGGGVISSGALLGATGGTQTHSRRTGRKLGRLRYARQGLVRVPESNTKYGGLGGITGGNPTPVIEPSISESTRIPKRKNYPGDVDGGFAPLFTGRGIFSQGAIEFSGLT